MAAWKPQLSLEVVSEYNCLTVIFVCSFPIKLEALIGGAGGTHVFDLGPQRLSGVITGTR